MPNNTTNQPTVQPWYYRAIGNTLDAAIPVDAYNSNAPSFGEGWTQSDIATAFKQARAGNYEPAFEQAAPIVGGLLGGPLGSGLGWIASKIAHYVSGRNELPSGGGHTPQFAPETPLPQFNLQISDIPQTLSPLPHINPDGSLSYPQQQASNSPTNLGPVNSYGSGGVGIGFLGGGQMAAGGLLGLGSGMPGNWTVHNQFKGPTDRNQRF